MAQVRARLARDGHDPARIDEALDLLREQGYLDDARYATAFAADRRELDGWGTERIERALHEAGVGEDDIATALAGFDRESELDAALGVLARRLGDRPRDDRARSRALGLLVRRGYRSELAYEAVRAFERGARSNVRSFAPARTPHYDPSQSERHAPDGAVGTATSFTDSRNTQQR